MEPTFLVVAQGLIQESHVNIGEYISASKWRTCEASFHKILAYSCLTSPSYKYNVFYSMEFYVAT
jgi:hypothetical protein